MAEAAAYWASVLPSPAEVAERFRRAGRVDPFTD
jgi:hypothetical protein